MFAMRYKQIGAKIVYYRMLKSMTQEQLQKKQAYLRLICLK